MRALTCLRSARFLSSRCPSSRWLSSRCPSSRWQSPRWLNWSVGFASLCGALSACASQPAEHPRPDPDYDHAMEQVCEVDRLAELNPDENLIGIEGERYEWMMGHVKHPDLIELVTLMRVESEARRAEMLRAALKRSTRARCSLAEHYEAGSG